MNFGQWLEARYAFFIRMEMFNFLRKEYPQLNEQSRVSYTSNLQVRVPIMEGITMRPPEISYSPREDLDGKLRLAAGAVFDRPELWNSGLVLTETPQAAIIPSLTVQIRQYGYRQPPDHDTYLYCGYCGYNDTIYIYDQS